MKVDLNLKELQSNLTNMLKEIAPILDENNINYYIVAGTLLGAIRHKGFIPWDDDIDISMPRPAYEDFIKKAASILPSHLLLETHLTGDSYPYLFAKIYDTRTTLVEGYSQPLVRGTYIDIFPLDGITSNPKKQSLYIRRMRNYQKIYRRVYTKGLKSQTFIKRVTHNVINPIIKLALPKAKLFNKVSSILNLNTWDTSDFINNYFGSWKEKEIHKKEWYAERINLNFNGVKVWGPKNYDMILKKMYGNYMELPPIHKQVSHHNISYLNLNLPYEKYKK